MSAAIATSRSRLEGSASCARRRGVIVPDYKAAMRLIEKVLSTQALVADIGPALALALLERNKNNRKIAASRVEVYARDMAAGRWQLNNQGVALGRDGVLYDGQHRLLAIVQADVTVPMLVVSGLDASARATIDQGRSRSVGDLVRMIDGISRGAKVVGWFRAIEQLVSKQRLPLSHGIIQDQLIKYDASVKWFLANVPQRQDLTRAPVVGALLYAHRVAAAEVERFVKPYMSGADLSEGSPMLALRNYVTQRVNIDKDGARTTSLKTLRCVLEEIRGESIKHLIASEDAFEYFRALHATT